MNKSLSTNICALLTIVLSVIIESDTLYYVGIFALSGALTNWLAIHMLFEKVPGLYGSGVIPSQFESFKLGIKTMMMEQFFNEKNVTSFLDDEASTLDFQLQPIIEKVDFSPTFDGLIEVIEQSSFGAMLEMVGGTAVIEPMREPFISKIKQSIIELTNSQQFKTLVHTQLSGGASVEQMIEKVERIVEQRLTELTPLLVKQIVQKMIKEHLGWLVIWGGVFGGVIGAVASVWS